MAKAGSGPCSAANRSRPAARWPSRSCTRTTCTTRPSSRVSGARRRRARSCATRTPSRPTTSTRRRTGSSYLAMELLRGRAPAPSAEGGGAARVSARPADPGSGRGVAQRGARQRHRSPRHEAGERLHRITCGRGPRQGARLRHRQGDVRRSPGAGADRGGPDPGHAGVHVAGAAARPEAGWALGHLRAGHDGLRDVDREAALPEREDADRHHQLPHETRGAGAVEAGRSDRDPLGRGRDHPQDGAEGPRKSLRGRQRPARGDRPRAALARPHPGPLRALPPGRRHRPSIVVAPWSTSSAADPRARWRSLVRSRSAARGHARRGGGRVSSSVGAWRPLSVAAARDLRADRGVEGLRDSAQ